MKIFPAHAPWPVRLAAIMIVSLIATPILRSPVGNESFSDSKPGMVLALVSLVIFETIHIAIAYGVLKGRKVVRLFWSSWAISSVIFVFAVARARFAGDMWRLITPATELATVIFLFLPSANDYYSRVETANHTAEPGSPSRPTNT
jgi:Kef-type K+ transport system membrane component KefB